MKYYKIVREFNLKIQIKLNKISNKKVLCISDRILCVQMKLYKYWFINY